MRTMYLIVKQCSDLRAKMSVCIEGSPIYYCTGLIIPSLMCAVQDLVPDVSDISYSERTVV